MAPHSSTLAWKIPWAEEPRRLQSIGSLRVGHNWLHFHFSLSCTGEGNGNPLQCSCLENPRDGRAWWAAVYGVAQNRTRLKWVSSREGKVVLPCEILIFLILNVSMLFLVQTSNHFLTKTIQVKILTIRTEGLLSEGTYIICDII